MATIEGTLRMPDGKILAALTLDPTGKSAIQIDNEVATAINAHYPSAAGYTYATSTLNEVVGCGIVILSDLIGRLLVTVTERINTDGTISRIVTITPP